METQHQTNPDPLGLKYAHILLRSNCPKTISSPGFVTTIYSIYYKTASKKNPNTNVINVNSVC